MKWLIMLIVIAAGAIGAACWVAHENAQRVEATPCYPHCYEPTETKVPCHTKTPEATSSPTASLTPSLTPTSTGTSEITRTPTVTRTPTETPSPTPIVIIQTVIVEVVRETVITERVLIIPPDSGSAGLLPQHGRCR